VAPEGSNDAVGSPDAPLRTIEAALERAQPGDTVELAPGEYRELLRTQRDGEPDAPITVTGPPEAVVRPTQDVNDAVLIEHNHFHLRGITINGLVDPERKYEDYRAWIPRCVNISPLRRREEGIEYLRDIVVEPSRLGNGARALIQVERVRNASIGNFEVIGPAGMQFDPRVDNHEVGHIREIVYVGSPEVHRGEDYYGYDTLDRSRDIRIHHIDNSEGYEHNELVDVKLGSSGVTVEYCTDRNAGHNTEGVVSAAIDLKGNDCTVRWNDIGECPLPVSFGAWAPSEDVDSGDWSQNNAVYGNHIHDFVAGPFRLRNEGDIGPVSFEDQRTLCGNRIDRGELDVEPWMVGANGFDRLVDRRGTDEVTVEVGAGSDGRALDPAAVVVDRGTTITWDWVEGSGSHYIVDRLRTAAPPESVPDPRPAPYSESETLDMVGMTRYACYAHHEEGMIGAVVVAESPDRYAFTEAACDSSLPDGDGVGHVGGDGRWS
jgi:plastocyanin